MTSPDQAKHVADAVAGTAVFASVMDWLPDFVSLLAAMLSVIWFALRIWESETVKKLTGRNETKE